jgi:hypothetical protein
VEERAGEGKGDEAGGLDELQPAQLRAQRHRTQPLRLPPAAGVRALRRRLKWGIRRPLANGGTASMHSGTNWSVTSEDYTNTALEIRKSTSQKCWYTKFHDFFCDLRIKDNLWVLK